MSKINYIGKLKIFNDKYVIKPEKDLNKIYDYLTSRDFKNFIRPIERINENNKYEYIIDNSLSEEQKLEDLAKTIGLLHSKTSYQKEINLDKYSEIYDNILGYINYINDYYKNMLKKIEYKEYNSPSEILFLSNYYKLNELLEFIKHELKKWFQMVKDKRKVRVVLNHGNLSCDHIINGNLISWRKASFDSPIVDLVNLFHREWEKYDFSNFANIYLEKNKLTEEEKKLLIINISIPLLITNNFDEFKNVCDIRKFYDYIFKVEELIRPYYSKENKE